MPFIRSLRPLAIAAAAVIGLASTAGLAQAQAWPNQTIRLIAPFPPGGSVDQIARLVAPHLQQSLGVSVVVENRSGASGSIGTLSVARAAPDGNTWVFVFDTHGVNNALIPNLQYDTVKSFSPLMQIGDSPYLIAGHPSLPYKTLREVLDDPKVKQNGIPYGSIGAGSIGHLTMAMVADRTKVNLTHVPYKGGGPMVVDAVANHVPLSIGTVALLSPHVAGSKLKPLAVTSRERAPQLPNVPTFAEIGLQGLEAAAWWGVLAPAGTPEPIMKRMHAELTKALTNPQVREKLDPQGVRFLMTSPAEFTRFLEAEVARWSKVVKEQNIVAQ
jgi:tripartite-type tricarboxylate transporter receptor subunit TctC